MNASRCGGVGNQRRLALIGLLVVIAISAILAGRLWGGEIAREPLALELPAPNSTVVIQQPREAAPRPARQTTTTIIDGDHWGF